MDQCHRLFPDLGGQTAACDTGQWRVVVIANPDARHIVRRKPDEPSVARSLRRA